MVIFQINLRWIFYPVLGFISYFGARHFFPTEEDRRQDPPPNIIKDPPPPNVIKDPEPLDVRGGWLKSGFFKQMFENNAKYVLIGTLAVCGAALGDRFRLVLAEILRDASPAIAGLPIPLARRLLEGFGELKPKQLIKALKEGLMSNELTWPQKLSLIKKTFSGLIIAAKDTGARKKLLLTALLIIISLASTNGLVFAGVLAVLQDLYTKIGMKTALIEFIHSVYMEYNAPIPEELAKLLEELPKKLIDK